MADQIIQDFMVRLGWKVDADGEKRFDKALTTAVTKANLLARGIEEMAVAVAKSVARVVGDFDRLTYASARTGTSVAGLKSLEHGFSQVGGSAQQAMAVVENFTRAMRMNPGLKGFVKQLGVDTTKEGADQLLEVVERLNRQPYHVAARQAEMLGIDETSFNLLTRQMAQLKAFRSSYSETARVIGLDGRKAAEASTALSQAWGKLAGSASVVAERFAADLMPHVTRFLNYLGNWVDRHGAEIGKFMDDLRDYAGRLASGMADLGKALEPIGAGFLSIAESLTGEKGLRAAMEAFGAFLVGTWLAKVLGAFRAIGVGWAGLLATLGLAKAANANGIMTPSQHGSGLEGFIDNLDPGLRRLIYGQTPQQKADQGKPGLLRRGWNAVKRATGFGSVSDDGPHVRQSGAVPSGQSGREQRAMARLIARGWTPEAAATAIGQAVEESGVRSDGPLGDTARFGTGDAAAHGMFQWRDGRFRALKKFAQERSTHWQDFDTQVDFFDQERKQRSARERAWHTITDLGEGNRIGKAFEGYAGGLQAQREAHARRLLNTYRKAAATPSSPIPPLPKPAGGGMTAEQFNERFNAGGPMGSSSINNSSADNRRFDFKNTTEIRIDGSNDPARTASAVKQALGRNHERDMRNATLNYR